MHNGKVSKYYTAKTTHCILGGGYLGRHCNTVVIALSGYWIRHCYWSYGPGLFTVGEHSVPEVVLWNVTSVNLFLSPVAQSCQLFKRAKQAVLWSKQSNSCQSFSFTFPVPSWVSCAIGPPKNCFWSFCSFVSISSLVGRPWRRTASAVDKTREMNEW